MKQVSIFSLIFTLSLAVGTNAALAQYTPPSPSSSVSRTPAGVVAPPAAPAPRPSNNTGAAVPPPPPADLMQSQSEREILEQSSGQYPVMERSTTYSLGALQKAWDAPYASAGQTAPGIMRYSFRPDFVMAVRTREYMVTTLNLPDWEQVTNVIVGDPVVFDAKRIKQNVIAVRPNHSGADTNLTAIGSSGNIYSFYVRSEGYNSDQVTDITVYVEANRPMASVNGTSVNEFITSASMDGSVSGHNQAFVNDQVKAPTPDYVREIDFKPENLKFDMKILAPTMEDAEIAPLRVFNDGIWTYFDFGHKADSVRRPVVYLVVDGVDTMVNTRTSGQTGNVLIAEAVGDFTLRNGNRVVCVHRTDRPLTARSDEFQDRMKQTAPSMQNQLYVTRQPYPPAPRPQPRNTYPSSPGFLGGISNWFGNGADVKPAPQSVEK